MYDELVKKIRHCATDPMHCLSCGEDKDGRCFKRLMTQAADAIEELQADKAALNGTVTNLLEQIKDLSKPRWIPVTERLPEEEGYYLCILKSFFGNRRFTDVCQYDGWYFIQDGIATERVTHWMPLPEPPEEE